jgi:hypothetical protein
MHCCARNIERLTRIPKLRTDLQSPVFVIVPPDLSLRTTLGPRRDRTEEGQDRGGTDEKFTANESSFAHKVTFRRSSKPRPATLRNRFR